MTDPSYVELHASSAFSFLEGASSPESLAARAAELGMPAMTITDRNGLYGAARFYTTAKRCSLQAHIGAEIAVHDFGHRLTPPDYLPHQLAPEPTRVTLLCESQKGYQNLCRLVSRFKLREVTKAEGAATLADLEEFSDGLICLTGGEEGPLAAALVREGRDAARSKMKRLSRAFGRGNLYIELQRHGIREEEWRNQEAILLAESLQFPIVATNGVRYVHPAEREVQDVFTAIKNGTDLAHAGRLLSANSQRYLRSPREMSAQFSDLPHAIAETKEISQRLSFQLHNLGYEFPRYPVPHGETMDSFLRKRVEEGVLKRYGAPCNYHLLEKARQQVERELGLIARLGFAGYFLIVWDIIRFCQRNDIMVQGRGSAANSAVCYALEITAVDPVGMELLFERFLSESRGEWPDIDLDLPSGEKREQAIQYIYQRYGELGAAMVANVITYRGRSAAREVGKALGFDQETLAKLGGLIGHWEWRGPTDTIAHHFQQSELDVRHPLIAKFLDITIRIQDLPRHLGQHSGGMVICQGQLDSVVPIERASMPGRNVVQWDKEDCADMGLIKVDLLGLGMMAVLKDCVELIPQHYRQPIDIAHLPEDPEVYAALRCAATVGMFQVESRAQMASLPRNAPRKFYDLVVQVAIIRPGPIVGKMMHPYMRRRQGREEVTYPHLSLEPVLKRTLGVPLFQEQLLRIAMIAANFTGAEAEELRRAVGMRRSMQRMKELEVKLRSGMSANGIDPQTQDSIVQQISSFALYGFPESHAASFALLAYASAYFKVKFLAAFTCAILNNQPMGFYMPAVLVKDAQRHGLRVKPIDVQRSYWHCTIEKEKNGALSLRLGLMYARGLRENVGRAIVQSRSEGGLFRGVEDFTLRLRCASQRELMQLARIGACNWLDEVAHRRDALWQMAQCGRPAGPLLETESANANREEEQWSEEMLRKMSTEERLVADFAGTGLTNGPHPMAYKRAELQRSRVLSAKDLQSANNGRRVRTAGCVIARQRPGTASGFLFLSLEDETGIANVIVHPELYESARETILRGKFLLVSGKLQNDGGVVHVRADHIQVLAVSAVEVESHDFH